MAMRNDTQRSSSSRQRSRKPDRSRRSPADVASALHGLDFPLSKSEIIAYADEHECGDAVIRALDHLPERVYESMAEVERDLTAAQREENGAPFQVHGNTLH